MVRHGGHAALACAALLLAPATSAAPTTRPPVELLLSAAPPPALAPAADDGPPPPSITSAMAAITAAKAVEAAPTIPLPARPSAAPAADACSPGCTDYDRRDGFTCAQQAAWGCGRAWMAGHCDRTCGRCGCGCPCSDASPRADADCRQLSDWGFCPVDENPWMVGACEVTCGRCAAAAPASSQARPAEEEATSPPAFTQCAPPAPSSGASVCQRRCYNRIAPAAPSPSVLAGRARAKAAAAAAVPSTPRPRGRGVATPAPGFVTVRGGSFYLDGAPWHFSGTNFYSALYPWWTPDQVRDALAAHADRGASVARVFAFTNGLNNTGFDMTLQTAATAIQPSLGVFSEAGLRRLDRLIADAGSAHLRLILALSNFWDEGGGALWYVRAVKGGTTDPATGRAWDRELFFSDRAVISAFKAYLTKILTRVNSITGLAYAADPTVMAWELANEPQTASYWEQDRGLVPGAAMTAWAAEVSALIKSLAPRQLACMGDEGWRVDGGRGGGGGGAASGKPFPATGLTPAPPTSLPGYGWMNDGAKGVDAVSLASLPTLDFMTVHVYAPNWGLSASEYGSLFTPFLADRAAVARAAGKPIILEEFGSPFGYVPDRDAFISAYSTAAAALGYAGALIWQVFPWKTRSSTGAGFDFDYDKSGGAGVAAMYEAFKARARLERGAFWVQ